MKKIRLTMGQALVKFLDNQYVEFDGREQKFVDGVMGIFGHGCVVGIGEALQESDHSLKFYQGHNEQGMAHVAIAYAKQHSRKKILAVTSSIGPGALNMVTAAGLATTNRIPLLLLPGDAFACRQPDPVLQQVEQFNNYTVTSNDAFRAVTRYWDRIERPEQLMSAGIQAMRVLTDPAETGAVCLALPQDVQGEAYDYPEEFFRKRVHVIDRRPLSQRGVEQAVELIRAAKRPLAICGGGVRYSEAGEVFGDFCDTFTIPFGETQAGKSAVTWDHAMNLGGMGVTGGLAANMIAKDADLIIAVGTRLSDFTTGSKWSFQNPNVKVLSLNVQGFDAYKMDGTPLLCDAKAGLEAIKVELERILYAPEATYAHDIEQAKLAWKKEVDTLYTTEMGPNGIYSQMRALGIMNEEVFEKDAIVVGASGSLPGDLQRVWRCRTPEVYHMEYGFSCMGYEVPAALGAKLAAPDQPVYSMVGDASFVMLHSELLTSIQEGVKINVMLFDNNGFGCIDNLQRSQGIPKFGCELRYRNPKTGKIDSGGDLIPVDYAKIAAGYGCKTWTVRTSDELRAALNEAKKSPVSTLIDIKVDWDSMTDGYLNWWRVGTPAVSKKDSVVEAHEKLMQEVAKVKEF